METKNRYDWIVIGGGAAGLFAAAHLPVGRHALLEATDRVGTKLLLAGSGMCNFTHGGPAYQLENCYGKRKAFVKHALRAYDNRQVCDFFRSLGVDHMVDARGKVFPLSRKASDIREALLLCAREKKVAIRTGCRVKQIRQISERSANSVSGFQITTANDDIFECTSVLIATGGRSYPTTGSDGSGYALAAQLGHTILTPRPALAPVLIEADPALELAGTALPNGRIRLVREGKPLGQWDGELLITHKGLSGPLILDQARYILPGDMIQVNWTRDHDSFEIFDQRLCDLATGDGRQKVKTALRLLLYSKQLTGCIMAVGEIDTELTLANLSKEQRRRLALLATAYPVAVRALGGFEIAMATAGGVSVDEIHAKTMVSKLVPRLYFAGEVMDVDGDTGGYNIQWAFSSARLAVQGL